MKEMHFIARSDGQGSHSAGTHCGLEVSNWHDDPLNEITFVEKDVTCVVCMKAAIVYLRDALNRSCKIDEEWLTNVRAYHLIVREAKEVLESDDTDRYIRFVEETAKR